MMENGKHTQRPPTVSSSSSSSQLTRLKSQKALRNQSNLPLEDERIERELMKEIETAREMIDNYQRKFIKKKKDKNKNNLEELRNMEKLIQNKDHQIKYINEEIRELKCTPDGIRKLAVKKYKSYEDAQIFKLADEIRHQRLQLQELQIQHSKKLVELHKRKDIMLGLEKKYLEVCTQTGKKPLLFHEFKEERKNKMKEDAKRLKKSTKRPSPYPSIKEVLEIQPCNPELTMKDVISKKQKVESALKVGRKKHVNQITQLNAKLEFLRDENQLLEGKLRQKQEELQAADVRFSESKKYREKRLKIKKLTQTDA